MAQEKIQNEKNKQKLEQTLDIDRLPIDEEKIIIYTDGSCSCNPGPGGYSALLMYKGKKKIIRNTSIKTTNNEMELMAVYSALKSLKKSSVVEINTDSGYVYNIFNVWIENWIANGWKRKDGSEIINKRLIEETYKLIKLHDVKFAKVIAHNGNIYNEICNILAQNQTKKILVQNGITNEINDKFINNKYMYEKYDYSREYRTNEVKFLKGFIDILESSDSELENYLNINHNMSFYLAYEQWLKNNSKKYIKKKQNQEKRKREKQKSKEIEKEEIKNFREKESKLKERLTIDFKKAQFGKEDNLRINQTLKIIPKYQCYFEYAYTILNNMKNWQRRTLGNTYYNTLEKTLTLLFEIHDQTDEVKLEIIRKIDAQISMQLTLIEYMHDLNILGNSKRESLIRMLCEIGKMIGGLKKNFLGKLNSKAKKEEDKTEIKMKNAQT